MVRDNARRAVTRGSGAGTGSGDGHPERGNPCARLRVQRPRRSVIAPGGTTLWQTWWPGLVVGRGAWSPGQRA